MSPQPRVEAKPAVAASAVKPARRPRDPVVNPASQREEELRFYMLESFKVRYGRLGSIESHPDFE